MRGVEPSIRCRYLEPDPVPICKAFTGGLRTPKDQELEHLCRGPDHILCPWYRKRVGREYTPPAGPRS